MPHQQTSAQNQDVPALWLEVKRIEAVSKKHDGNQAKAIVFLEGSAFSVYRKKL